MPAYNFQKQFASDVERGFKRCTIRPRRKRPTVPGDILFLFTGQRTKQCRRLLTTACVAVEPITVTSASIRLDGRSLTTSAAHCLARADGFDTVEAFRSFFRKIYGLPTKNMEQISW